MNRIKPRQAYFLSSIFARPAEVQLAGKRAFNYPQCWEVFDMFHALYQKYRVIPIDLLVAEIEKFGPAAQAHFKTRQTAVRVVQWYARGFADQGLLVIGDAEGHEEEFAGFQLGIEGGK